MKTMVASAGAERRAALDHEGATRGPRPARIPRATKGPLVAHGDRPTYSSDEGLS